MTAAMILRAGSGRSAPGTPDRRTQASAAAEPGSSAACTAGGSLYTRQVLPFLGTVAKKMRTHLMALVAAALAGGLAAQARTWVVDAGGGGDFTDLAPALAAARDGDVIRIRPGLYNGGSTSKALTIVGDAGARVRTTTAFFGRALQIKGLPRGRTFVLAGITAERGTTYSPGIFLSIEDCKGHVHVDRLVADLLQLSFNSATSHVAVFVSSSDHVTLQDSFCTGSTALSSRASTLVLNECSMTGEAARDHPFSGPRSAGPAAESSQDRLVITESRLTGGNGTNRWLGGGYVAPAEGLRMQGSTVTLAGSSRSSVAAGSAVPVDVSAVAGAGGSLLLDPRVVLTPNRTAPAVAVAIPTRTVRLPAVTATGAAPGGTLAVDLIASNGDLADVYLSLPAYPVPSPIPGTGELWIDFPTWIVLGRFRVPPSERISLRLALPPLPGLRGVPIRVQGVAGTAAGFRFCTPATVVLD